MHINDLTFLHCVSRLFFACRSNFVFLPFFTGLYFPSSFLFLSLPSLFLPPPFPYLSLVSSFSFPVPSFFLPFSFLFSSLFLPLFRLFPSFPLLFLPFPSSFLSLHLHILCWHLNFDQNQSVFRWNSLLPIHRIVHYSRTRFERWFNFLINSCGLCTLESGWRDRFRFYFDTERDLSIAQHSFLLCRASIWTNNFSAITRDGGMLGGSMCSTKNNSITLSNKNGVECRLPFAARHLSQHR